MRTFDDLPPLCIPPEWDEHVLSLFEDIMQLLSPSQWAGLQVNDIKEKFGELRIYWSCDVPISDELDDTIEKMIDELSERLRAKRR
jgi:hypothetical protein